MDKPLHVQVAEALGWRGLRVCGGDDRGCADWVGAEPGQPLDFSGDDGDASGHVPRYDTDWSATGPLIEKYGVASWIDPQGIWHAISLPSSGEHRDGDTPLEAVCSLLLALHKAGKLNA